TAVMSRRWSNRRSSGCASGVPRTPRSPRTATSRTVTPTARRPAVVNEVLFWVVAGLTVVPALSLLFARRAAHIAMSIVLVMVGLAAAYVGLDAPFLGVVQIVVYTGAVMMMFLFVLMLVGVD